MVNEEFELEDFTEVDQFVSEEKLREYCEKYGFDGINKLKHWIDDQLKEATDSRTTDFSRILNLGVMNCVLRGIESAMIDRNRGEKK